MSKILNVGENRRKNQCYSLLDKNQKGPRLIGNKKPISIRTFLRWYVRVKLQKNTILARSHSPADRNYCHLTP